jgi:hypothetical protein
MAKLISFPKAEADAVSRILSGELPTGPRTMVVDVITEQAEPRTMQVQVTDVSLPARTMTVEYRTRVIPTRTIRVKCRTEVVKIRGVAFTRSRRLR